ncbi:hypothetical protein [Methyloversatilis sp.]|uniref:hypothetical protein n=1 Tax=Methyloversatilis sp. TaxID=2569862 RepID=UPI0027324B53|nr:hypothetical protein [Methyloversatilis sp.]MDP2867804.1 hypothetical protein [Methyloversatilis sp.]MDP3455070.1 hypothetical protein [Methyloversatilis sp.]MDP3577285.1 hypothetical protein [Methyloversatilis sp.]
MKKVSMYHVRVGDKLITLSLTTESGAFRSAKVGVSEYFPQFRVLIFDSVNSSCVQQHEFDDRESALRFLQSEMLFHATREQLVDGHLLEHTEYTENSYETYIEFVPVFRVRKIDKRK